MSKEFIVILSRLNTHEHNICSDDVIYSDDIVMIYWTGCDEQRVVRRCGLM